MNVGVVGAGTAGTATALLLARDGHQVTLYERVAEPAPVGAGIVLQPTGQAVLKRLGLLAPMLEHGARIDRLHCVTGTGRTVFDLDYRPLGPELFGLGLHRGLLFQTLVQAATKQSGLQIRYGVDIDAPKTVGRGVMLRTTEGEELGPHELVVVADGARSVLREHVGLPFRERPYAWGALWHVAEDREQIYAGQLYQVLRGATSMLGLLPLAYRPNRLARRRGPRHEPAARPGVQPRTGRCRRAGGRARRDLGGIARRVPPRSRGSSGRCVRAWRATFAGSYADR